MARNVFVEGDRTYTIRISKEKKCDCSLLSKKGKVAWRIFSNQPKLHKDGHFVPVRLYLTTTTLEQLKERAEGKKKLRWNLELLEYTCNAGTFLEVRLHQVAKRYSSTHTLSLTPTGKQHPTHVYTSKSMNGLGVSVLMIPAQVRAKTT